MLKKIILCLSLMVSVTAFSQTVLRSKSKVVCSWNTYKQEFDNCVDSRTDIKFFFNNDYTILYSVGDVEATFYLDEGEVLNDVLTFEADLVGDEHCVIYLDSKNNLLKFMFDQNGTTILVIYLL